MGQFYGICTFGVADVNSVRTFILLLGVYGNRELSVS
jgi:hypothetical protein